MELESFAASQTDVAGFYSLVTQQADTTKRKAKRVSKVRLDLPRLEPGGRFIKGPIPLEWLKVASRCGNRSEAVGILLWYLAGWQRCNPVKLTPATLAELRVHPKTARRVLASFASAGLVSVESKRGCSPIVTLLSPSATVTQTLKQPFDYSQGGPDHG